MYIYTIIKNYSFISIFIVIFLGTYNLMTACKTLSSAGISMTLECILISKLSKVAVPLPQGDFLVVILSFLVGSGIGPDIGVPALLAISAISEQILFNCSIFVLFNLILT